MLDLGKIRKVYVIGIKGSGIVAIVEILKALGVEITGSDTGEKFFTDAVLERLEISYFENFDKDNIPADTDLVLYSTAYNGDNNIEFQEARRKNLPMISYPEILSDLFGQKYGIAVSGTHGKTTTAALLANTLKELELDPTAVVGSKVFNWGGNALVGKGEYFIAEADEFQNKLGLYDPKGVILTSVDFDHPDFFENFEEYKEVFRKFVARIPKSGFLVVWGDSVDTLEISKSAICDVLTYGFSKDCDFLCKKIACEEVNEEGPGNRTQKFKISFRNKDLGEYEIRLVGQHNILNATAVIAICYKLGLDLAKVRKALRNFQGTARRFEYVGEKNGAVLIDDYGHHPEEVKATLKAAREIYPEKNIWAVFHPHTFTRTKALLSEFSQSFDDADKVIVLDIYGSAREEQGGVHSSDLVKEINKFNRDKAEYIPTIEEAVTFLEDKIGPDDVVIAIGAGNVWEVVEKLKEK